LAPTTNNSVNTGSIVPDRVMTKRMTASDDAAPADSAAAARTAKIGAPPRRDMNCVMAGESRIGPVASPNRRRANNIRPKPMSARPIPCPRLALVARVVAKPHRTRAGDSQ